MTLQQLEYIVALNKYKHFVNAAEACNVTQPTLSTMIHRLEEELDIKIFDRTKHPIEPTAMGKRIITQAESIIAESKKIQEMIKGEAESLSGILRLGIIPTIAPYIVPKFISSYSINYPNIKLKMNEMQTRWLVRALKDSIIDMAILSTPLDDPDILEIPLYYENFILYESEKEQRSQGDVEINEISMKDMWVLQEGHCARTQILSICHSEEHNKLFEAGSIDTLIRIVDVNGGCTLIPELHIPFLNEEQQKRTRKLKNTDAQREISIIVRKDYIKEAIINSVASTVKKIIPPHMYSGLLSNNEKIKL